MGFLFSVMSLRRRANMKTIITFWAFYILVDDIRRCGCLRHRDSSTLLLTLLRVI